MRAPGCSAWRSTIVTAVIFGIALTAGGAAAQAQATVQAQTPPASESNGPPAPRREGNWTLIGFAEVDVRRRTAKIDLSRASGPFKAFSITSGGSRFTVARTRFVFKEGGAESSRRRIYLRPGRRSPALARSRRGRLVDRAELVFRVGRGGRGKREVEIWGLQSEADRLAALSKPADETTAKPETETEATERAPDEPGTGQRDEDAAAAGETPGDTAPAEAAKPENDDNEVREPQVLTDIDQGPPPLPGRVVPRDTVAAGDVLLGARTVSFEDDRDVIVVGRRLGKFSRLRVRVLGRDITFKTMKIDYVSGADDVVAFDTTVRPQTKSDWVDVKPQHFIDKVAFAYAPKEGVSGTARIEVFGEHAQGWLGAQGEGRKYNGGWVLLAARTAGFVGFEKDDIPVGENSGGFRQLRLKVRERAITLNTIKVVYNDGEADEIPVKARVDAGSVYGPIRLRKPNDRISRIEARYRSRFSDRKAKSDGSAIVEFWAQH